MNEQIRQLVTQSGLDIYGLGAKRVPWEAALEQFAQLIVAECMNQVRDEVQYITDWNKADHVVNTVKKHFGVEL